MSCELTVSTFSVPGCKQEDAQEMLTHWRLIAGVLRPAYASFLSLHFDGLSHYKEVLEAAQIKVEAQGAVMPYSGIGRLAPSRHTYNVYCVEIFA